MSLEMRLGKRGNLLNPYAGDYKQMLLPSPILLEKELDAITENSMLQPRTFDLHYAAGDADALRAAVANLCAEVEAAVRDGCQVVVLSDRVDPQSLSADRPPIPALLATGAVHHALIKAGVRAETSIVVDTAQCFSTHHAAVLVGYGAHAVCPWLAFESCRQWRMSSRTQALISTGKVGWCVWDGCAWWWLSWTMGITGTKFSHHPIHTQS